mgnify:CR=1 FL=1
MSALFYFSPFTIRVFVLLIAEKAFGAILYGGWQSSTVVCIYGTRMEMCFVSLFNNMR